MLPILFPSARGYTRIAEISKLVSYQNKIFGMFLRPNEDWAPKTEVDAMAVPVLDESSKNFYHL